MKKQDFWWKFAYLVASFAVILLDQASKAWARKALRFGDEVNVIPNFLNFVYAENTGVAFSQLNNGGDFGRWMLSVLAALAAFAVLYYFWRTARTADRTLGACALLLAGIVGRASDLSLILLTCNLAAGITRLLTLLIQQFVLVPRC